MAPAGTPTSWTPHIVDIQPGVRDPVIMHPAGTGGHAERRCAPPRCPPAGDVTGFDPPGQPSPPTLSSGTSGGARVRLAAPAERWGGFGTRGPGTRARLAIIPTATNGSRQGCAERHAPAARHSLEPLALRLGPRRGPVGPMSHKDPQRARTPCPTRHCHPGTGMPAPTPRDHPAIRVRSTGWLPHVGYGALADGAGPS